MKQTRKQWKRMAATTVLGALFAAGQTMPAETHRRNAGYAVLSETDLGAAKAADMFLRHDRRGRSLLYIGCEDGTLAVLDVSNPKQPVATDELRLTDTDGTLHVRPISNRIAVATRLEDSAGELAVIDLGNGPTAEVARVLKNADAYTLDGASKTVYVAAGGKLVVLRFEHPVTRDEEIWEQWYNAR